LQPTNACSQSLCPKVHKRKRKRLRKAYINEDRISTTSCPRKVFFFFFFKVCYLSLFFASRMTIKMHEFGILTSWLVDTKNKRK
jgi:hypothetical protein